MPKKITRGAAPAFVGPAPVDLDTLLYGNCSWEDVQYFFARDGEFYDESYLVLALQRHLRTGDDAAWLRRHNLSLEQILNGRYPIALAHEVAQMLGRWNQRLGCRYFVTGAEVLDPIPPPQPAEGMIYGYHAE